MEGTQKLQPVHVVDRGGGIPAPLIVAVVLLAAGLACAMLLAQPGLVKALTALWGSLPASSRGPDWVVPVVAIGVAMGGATLCVLVLSAFVRGVQTAPYVWLSPLLVGFSAIVLARMRIELPLAYLSAPLFAAFAGALLLGGGALVQLRGWPTQLSGAFLLALPLLTLVAGYAHLLGGFVRAWHVLDSSGALFLFVLTLTSAGVGLVAFVTRPSGPGGDVVQRTRKWQEHGDQLALALERASLSEMRQAEAERRAEIAEYSLHAQGAQFGTMLPPRIRTDDTETFIALARPGLGRSTLLMTSALVMLAIGLLAYLGAYRPLARRAAAQQAFVAEAAKEHAKEIDTLRKHFEAERAALYASVAAERVKVEQALTAAEQARGATQAPSSEVAPIGDAAPAAAKPTIAKAVVPPPAAVPKSAAHAVSKHSARASKSHHATASRDKGDAPHPKTAAHESAHATGETLNDDPIGGLEGM
jgi:hypothetical protein